MFVTAGGIEIRSRDVQSENVELAMAVTPVGSVIDGSVEKRVGERVTVLVTDNGPEVDEEVRILDESGNELGRGALTIHSVFRVTGFTGTVSQVTFGENMLVNAASILFNLTDTGYSAHYNSVLKQRKEKEKTLLLLVV